MSVSPVTLCYLATLVAWDTNPGIASHPSPQPLTPLAPRAPENVVPVKEVSLEPVQAPRETYSHGIAPPETFAWQHDTGNQPPEAVVVPAQPATPTPTANPIPSIPVSGASAALQHQEGRGQKAEGKREVGRWGDLGIGRIRFSNSPDHPITRSPDHPITQASPETPFPNENQPLNPKDVETELGEIRIIRRPAQPPPPRQADVQLLLRSSVFTSSNITALETFRPSDTVFVNSAFLLATPKLGAQTRLVAAAGGGLVRFARREDFNYNFLNVNVGVQQRLAPGTYAQLGWVQERLYRDGSGDRLVLDNSARLILGRQDQVAKHLRLDSFYELRASFADPKDQSRVANTLGARLRYDITPSLQGAVDYRLTLKDFTRGDRSDTEHQVGAEVIYSVNQNLFVGGTLSYLFGSSSNKALSLNNFSVGVNVGLNLPLF